MNTVAAAVSGALKGTSISSWVRAPILSTSFMTRNFTSMSNPQEEVEDMLYKRCEVECRSVDPAVLRSYSTFAQKAARELGITVGDIITPRKPHKKRWTTLKSVFIYNKHRVQYEVRTYYHTMNFLHLTGSTADTFLEYIQRNLPEGVAMKVTKVQLQRLPEHLKTPPDVSVFEEEIAEEKSQPTQKNV